LHTCFSHTGEMIDFLKKEVGASVIRTRNMSSPVEKEQQHAEKEPEREAQPDSVEVVSVELPAPPGWKKQMRVQRRFRFFEEGLQKMATATVACPAAAGINWTKIFIAQLKYQNGKEDYMRLGNRYPLMADARSIEDLEYGAADQASGTQRKTVAVLQLTYTSQSTANLIDSALWNCCRDKNREACLEAMWRAHEPNVQQPQKSAMATGFYKTVQVSYARVGTPARGFQVFFPCTFNACAAGGEQAKCREEVTPSSRHGSKESGICLNKAAGAKSA